MNGESIGSLCRLDGNRVTIMKHAPTPVGLYGGLYSLPNFTGLSPGPVARSPMGPRHRTRAARTEVFAGELAAMAGWPGLA